MAVFLCYNVSDLVEIRRKRISQLICRIIALLDVHPSQVDLEGYRLSFDLTEIPLSYCLWERVFICQGFKELSQILHIPSVRSCSHTQHICILKIFQNALIALRQGVMSLINYDGSELIGTVFSKPALTLESLDRAHNHRIH